MPQPVAQLAFGQASAKAFKVTRRESHAFLGTCGEGLSRVNDLALHSSSLLAGQNLFPNSPIEENEFAVQGDGSRRPNLALQDGPESWSLFEVEMRSAHRLQTVTLSTASTVRDFLRSYRILRSSI